MKAYILRDDRGAENWGKNSAKRQNFPINPEKNPPKGGQVAPSKYCQYPAMVVAVLYPRPAQPSPADAGDCDGRGRTGGRSVHPFSLTVLCLSLSGATRAQPPRAGNIADPDSALT